MPRSSSFLGRIVPGGVPATLSGAVFAVVFFWGAVALIVNYVVLTVWYLGLDNYFSFVEPNNVSIAWTAMTGGPVYHDLDSAAQYSLVYGPSYFLVNGWLLKLFGPSILASKLGSVLFALFSVFGLVFCVGRAAGPRIAVMAGGYLVLTYFGFWPFGTFIARADAFILGLVALGLVGAHARTRWAAVLLSAVAVGVCFNVKVHSPMYFLPGFALLFQRHGFGALVKTGVAAAAVAVLPFLLFPNVSLANYVLWMRVVGDVGLELTEFLITARNVFLLQLLPALLALSLLPGPLRILKERKLFLAALGLSMAVILVIASVAGAGKFHMIPFSISITYWLAVAFAAHYNEHYEGHHGETAGAVSRVRGFLPGLFPSFFLRRWVVRVLLLLFLLQGVSVNLRMVKLSTYNARYNGAVADIREILAAYPDRKIGMGNGAIEHDELTHFRPLLVFAGNPYLIDAIAFMVLKKAGHTIGPNTVAAIRACAMDIWLIPLEDTPFTINSVYAGATYLYTKAFRKAFFDRYELRERRGHYSLWFCKD